MRIIILCMTLFATLNKNPLFGEAFCKIVRLSRFSSSFSAFISDKMEEGISNSSTLNFSSTVKQSSAAIHALKSVSKYAVSPLFEAELFRDFLLSLVKKKMETDNEFREHVKVR